MSESLPSPDAVPAAFTLTELTAMVVISGYNPNFINPESFRQNGIVDGDWNLEAPVVVGGSRTSFRYTNGVEVWANPDFLAVTQKGDSLQVSECRGHQAVSRYVEIAPANVFHAVGFDLEGSIRLPDGAGHSLPLGTLNQRLTLDATQPTLEIKALYEQEEGKELALSWTEHMGPSNQENPHLSLKGYIRLSVPKASEERESQQAFVRDVLTHRERYLQEFWSLIQQLADLYQPGGA